MIFMPVSEMKRINHDQAYSLDGAPAPAVC
jgi:hypothetical protein